MSLAVPGTFGTSVSVQTLKLGIVKIVGQNLAVIMACMRYGCCADLAQADAVAPACSV